MSKISLACVILAGGKSSRMKCDKTLLKVGGEELISLQYNKMQKIFKNVYVSTKKDKFKQSFPLILDLLVKEKELFSPMLAFYSIYEYFKGKNEHIFILGADLPNVDEAVVLKLLKNLKEGKSLIARTKQYKHPLCGFYHMNELRKTKQLLEKGVQKLGVLNKDACFLDFEGEDKFVNLNEPCEFESWLLNAKT